MRLGNGRESEIGDHAGAKDQAVRGTAELEVPEFLTLGDVVPEVMLGSMMQEDTSDMPTGTKATGPMTGLSASMRMIARAAVCAM